MYTRPHVAYILEELARFFDLAVYSLGSREYVNAVVNSIDPSGSLFKHVLSRNHNKFNEVTQKFSKDMSYFFELGWLPENVIMIDNSEEGIM